MQDKLLDLYAILNTATRAAGYAPLLYPHRHRVAGCDECNAMPLNGPPHDTAPDCEYAGEEHCACPRCYPEET